MANEPKDTRVPEPEPPHETLCSSHQRVLQFYCQVCKIPVCQACTIRDHKEAKGEHELIEASEAFNNFRVAANDLMLKANVYKQQTQVGRSMCIANASDLNNSRNDIKKQINETVEEMVTLVRDIGKELDLKLSDICETKEKKIKAQIDELKSTASDTEEKQNYITELLKTNEATALQTSYEAIQELQQRIKVLPEIEPRDDGKVYFSSRKDHALDSIQKHGIGSISEKPNGNIFEIVSENPITVTSYQTFHVEIAQRYECEIDISDLTISTQKITLFSKPSTEDTSPTPRIVRSNGKYFVEGSSSSSLTLDVKFCKCSIKGSPIKITVEPAGIVQSIKNVGQSTGLMCRTDHNGIHDLVMSENGWFLVACICKREVFKFDILGAFICSVTTSLNTTDVYRIRKLKNNNLIFSARWKNDKYGDQIGVQIRDENGNKVNQFIPTPSFKQDIPLGANVNETSNEVYIVEPKNSQVLVHTGNWGRIGYGEGSLEFHMNRPSDVAVTKEGNVIVADTDNHRVQLFSSDRKFLKILIGGGEGDGMVIKPNRVEVDNDDNLIVASECKVQLFDTCGKFSRIIHQIQKGEGASDFFALSIVSHFPRRLALAEINSLTINVINY